MKRIIISSFGILALLVLTFGCKKGEINGDASNLVLGSYAHIDSIIADKIVYDDPNSTVSVKIGATVGEEITSINVYAATGDPLDNTTWSLVKTVPYSDGLILTVNSTELQKAYGSTPLQGGVKYVLQNEFVTKSGRKFSAFNTPTNYSSFAVYGIGVTWYANSLCKFVQADAIGTYKVVTDTWQDYSKGDQIQVTAGPNANEIQFLMYPSAAFDGVDRQPLVVTANVADGIATVANQYTGGYGDTSAGNIVHVKGSGIVFSCTGFITLTLVVNVGGTDYNATFEIQKI